MPDIRYVHLLPVGKERLDMADKMESFLAARATINTEVARAAWNDDAFRRSLVADPKAVIAKRLGQPLPAGITVTVHEESPTHFHLVIPAKPDQNAALSDEEKWSASSLPTSRTRARSIFHSATVPA